MTRTLLPGQVTAALMVLPWRTTTATVPLYMTLPRLGLITCGQAGGC
jgi:hypothetical protein